MIATLKEAREHANHSNIQKSNFVFVLPDGHIYLFDKNDKAQIFFNANPECFIVKGEIFEAIKEKKVKEIKDKK